MNLLKKDFLLEIGTEELPARLLNPITRSLGEQLGLAFSKAGLSYSDLETFSTPRRIAVRVAGLTSHQPDQTTTRTGPNLSAAYDENGQPTPAALGFAKSCQVSIEQLAVKDTPKGQCLSFEQTTPGSSIFELAPPLIKNALAALPIPKPMRWGIHELGFIRPVHWIVLLYGEDIIPCELFSLSAGRHTFGHRFHHPEPILLENPAHYVDLLTQGFVVPLFEERLSIIRDQLCKISKETAGNVSVDEDLLTEVTGLVEWPRALLGNFDPRFLKVPPEALISAMRTHQKSFPVMDDNGQLLPQFITIANVVSKKPEQVVAGNERVMRARLSDAEFFYQTDLKQGMSVHLERLKTILFQNKLGTLYEKACRLSKLTQLIMKQLAPEYSE